MDQNNTLPPGMQKINVDNVAVHAWTDPHGQRWVSVRAICAWVGLDRNAQLEVLESLNISVEDKAIPTGRGLQTSKCIRLEDLRRWILGVRVTDSVRQAALKSWKADIEATMAGGNDEFVKPVAHLEPTQMTYPDVLELDRAVRGLLYNLGILQGAKILEEKEVLPIVAKLMPPVEGYAPPKLPTMSVPTPLAQFTHTFAPQPQELPLVPDKEPSTHSKAVSSESPVASNVTVTAGESPEGAVAIKIVPAPKDWLSATGVVSELTKRGLRDKLVGSKQLEAPGRKHKAYADSTLAKHLTDLAKMYWLYPGKAPEEEERTTPLSQMVDIKAASMDNGGEARVINSYAVYSPAAVDRFAEILKQRVVDAPVEVKATAHIMQVWTKIPEKENPSVTMEECPTPSSPTP